MRKKIETVRNKTDLERGHDLVDFFVVQLENAVKNGDLIISQRFFTGAVKLKERLEFSLLVRMRLVGAKHIVQKFCYWPGDGSFT